MFTRIALMMAFFFVPFCAHVAIHATWRALSLEKENAELRAKLAARPSPNLYIYAWRAQERNAKNN